MRSGAGVLLDLHGLAWSRSAMVKGSAGQTGSGSCPPGRWATSRRINVRSTTGSSRGHAEPGKARRDAVPGRGAGGAVAAGDPGRRGIRLTPGVSGSAKRNSLPCLGGCPPCGGGFHGAKTPLARRGRRLPAAHADEVLDYADLGRGGLRDVEPQCVQHIWHEEVRPQSVRTGRCVRPEPVGDVHRRDQAPSATSHRGSPASICPTGGTWSFVEHWIRRRPFSRPRTPRSGDHVRVLVGGRQAPPFSRAGSRTRCDACRQPRRPSLRPRRSPSARQCRSKARW